MVEIEIKTTGEVRMDAEIVGHITFARPYIESDVAGVYDNSGENYDEFGALCGCSGCYERQELLDDASRAVEDINDLGFNAQVMLADLGWEDVDLNKVIQKIRKISDEIEFEI